MSQEGKPIVIRPEPARLAIEVYPPTVWLSYSFAREWFDDLVTEARQAGHNARRREIIFAVCFAETYLFEWVRDDVLKRDFSRLETYFPAGAKRGVREKWKEIPKHLKRDGLIKDAPDTGDSHGDEWTMLIDYRDGLVHASASKPETASLPPDQQPIPTKGTLDSLEQGWAARIVIERVRRLNEATGTAPPAWLRDP